MPPQILIAEDDRVLRRVLEFTLRRAGFRVVPVADSNAAMRCLVDMPMDILVTDHQMPGMTGLDLIRWSAQHALPPERCVLCTAKGLELDRDQLTRSIGVAALICKPFSPTKLVETVSHILAAHPTPNHSMAEAASV